MTVRSGGTVGDFMHRHLVTIPPGATIVEAAERMRGQQLGSSWWSQPMQTVVCPASRGL